MNKHLPRVPQALALGLAAALLALGGCSGTSPASMPANGGAPADAAASYPESGPAPTDDTGMNDSADRKIARTASIMLIVDDIQKAADGLAAVADNFQGTITAESLSLPDQDGYSSGYSSVVVTVVSENLNEALAEIAKLGRVTQRQIQSEDVTEQVVDVDARIKTMRESIARLQELMTKAGSVTAIAEVESELTKRQAELESLLATQKSLNQRVATAPISVQLRTESQAPPPVVSGFLPGLQAGWDSMVTAGQLALTVLGALLPWAVLIAIIVAPIVVVRRRRRARAGQAPTAGTPQPAAPMPGAPQPAAAQPRPVPAQPPARPDAQATAPAAPTDPGSATPN